MKAVIFGPGRIGCGFVGQVLREAGFELCFVGRGAVVEHLSRLGRYQVRLTDGRRERDLPVDGVRALALCDEEAVAAAVAEADLVAVSVGPQSLALVAPALAAGLRQRPGPVNVLAFENCADPGGSLRAALLRAAPELASAGHGIASALASRIVARRTGDPASDRPLCFVGDPEGGFAVHGPSLCAPLPALPGLRVVEDYAACLARKLFTFSAGHAAAAYLGALKGYHFVHTAIRDPEVRAAVLDAMEEGRRGLLCRFGPELAGTREDLLRIVARFDNAMLDDPVSRVGRDPLRKLGPDDRLVGAARLAGQAGVKPRRLALVAAAALCFERDLRGGSVAQEPDAALRSATGLDPGQGLGREVARAFARLTEGRESDNVLLSLRRLVWSWARGPLAAASGPGIA
jgi:mannitol-1-phosphate 5-dehydrogenase